MRESGSPFSLGVIAAMLACAAAFLGIGAPAASAAPEAQPAWAPIGSFGSHYSNFVEHPRSPLALGGNGSLFTLEEPSYGFNVYKLDGAGGAEFLNQISAPNARNLAVDPSNDDVYIDENLQSGGGKIRRLTSDGSPSPTYTIDPSFELPQGDALAFDATTGTLLVADASAEAIRRYDTSGTLVGTISTPSISPSWLIALPDGSLYVAAASGSDLTHLSSTGTVLDTIAGVGPLRGLSYDPVREVIVTSIGGIGSTKILTYSPAGSRLSEVPGGMFAVGLVVDASGLLYEDNSASINAYAPAILPGVETPVVSNLTPESFHLSTEVDPGAGPPAGSAMRFEYSADNGQSWISLPDHALSGPGTIEDDVTGLQPNFKYLVRAVASNSLISKVTDSIEAMTPVVPPAVVTGGATDATETSAVLNGTINAFGLQTTYYFEYGTTAAYGSRIPAGIEAVAGGGRSPQLFSRTITGLAPGTTYHYRLVATSSAGKVEGLDRTFTTVGAGGIPFRAYEQVTPADKRGAAIIPRLSLQASADGNGLTYITKTGSDASPILTRSVALRGASDWQGKIDTDPPLNAANGSLLLHPTLALSSDYRHALVVSNRVLTPEGGFEQGANIYVRDLISDTFQLVGASDAPAAFNNFTGASSTGTYMAGAPDFSWVIFASPPPLLPGVPRDSLYRWSETDGLEVLSTLPNGEPSAAMRANVAPVYHIVSDDGSRIYYSAVGGAEEGVFMREDGGVPKPISVSRVPGDPATPRPAILLGTNASGRYAFLSSETKLTSDAPGQVGDLYRYDAEDESLEYLGAGAYIELSTGYPAVGLGSMGIGEDGNTLYFIGLSGCCGKGDLSVWHEGAVHTITSGAPGSGEERSSPNGRYTVFTTSVGATGSVIQLYDVEANETSCVSCLSDGTPVSATLPENTSGDLLFSNRSPLAVDDLGTVYFDTPARLVAADVNGTRDVYAYRGGISRLISPGNRPFEASYADATADGSNVFFTTAQKLVGRDNDESIDLYDARVNGGLPAQNPPPPQECLRDDCKATPNAGPELPFGGSEALSGPENVKPPKHKRCGKGKRAKKVKGKVKCVKKHKAGTNKKGGNR